MPGWVYQEDFLEEGPCRQVWKGKWNQPAGKGRRPGVTGPSVRAPGPFAVRVLGATAPP